MFNVGSEGRLGHVQLKNGELARRAASYRQPLPNRCVGRRPQCHPRKPRP
jgi:hypothetical protein